MQTPKFQVFISSTYEDLKMEREQVMKAVLEMGHIPVGMELFSAGDEEQWKLIQRQIDHSDYYVVIVAHRYGSRDGDISYTEKEYDYATAQRVPAVGFVIAPNAPWPQDRVDIIAPDVRDLAAFVDKIKRKMVGFWSNADDLNKQVIISLMKLFNSHPRPGWVRASEQPGAATTAELTRLSQENAELRRRIQDLQHERKRSARDRIDRVLRTLSRTPVDISIWRKSDKDWFTLPPSTLGRLFIIIGPSLQVEADAATLAYSIAFQFSEGKEVRDTWPYPVNALSDVLSDLSALGVVEPSHRRHSVKDKGEYWSLTDFGRSVLMELRRRGMSRKAQRRAAEEAPPPTEPGVQSLGQAPEPAPAPPS